MPAPPSHDRARDLFAPVAPHLVHEPSDTAVWFLEPWGYAMQFRRPTRIDLAIADFMIGPLYTRLLALRGGVPRRAFWIADWTAMTGYDSAARTRLTTWALGVRSDIERIVCAIPRTNAIVKMGIEVAATGLRVMGTQFEIASSVDAAIARHALRPRA